MTQPLCLVASTQHTQRTQQLCRGAELALESGRAVSETRRSRAHLSVLLCKTGLRSGTGCLGGSAGWQVHSGCPIQTPRLARVSSSLPFSSYMLPVLSLNFSGLLFPHFQNGNEGPYLLILSAAGRIKGREAVKGSDRLKASDKTTEALSQLL